MSNLLDDLKQRVDFRKNPPRVFNIEDVSPPEGWQERFDAYDHVVRLEFNCSECHRGTSWVHPQLAPLGGVFAFAHCGRTDRYEIGKGPIKEQTK